MDKKGWVKGYKSFLSFILGIIFLFVGSFQLFFKDISILKFLSSLLNNELFIYICLIIGGIFFFIDSFFISHGLGKLLSILAGILLLVAGALPIIVIKLKLLSITLPFTNLSVFQGIIAFFGIYLIIDAFLMKSHFELHQ